MATPNGRSRTKEKEKKIRNAASSTGNKHLNRYYIIYLIYSTYLNVCLHIMHVLIKAISTRNSKPKQLARGEHTFTAT